MSIASITSAVDIVNMALQRLGQPVITTLTENSRDAILANQLYTQNRDFCLGLAEWDCLMQRAVLTRSAQIAISTITKANPAVVTCTGHVFYANELVTVESVSGMTQINDSLYRIFSATSTTITLYNTDGSGLNSSSYSAYSSGGYVYRGAGKFAFSYDLPSDCIRVVKVLDSTFEDSAKYSFKKERTFIYTDIEDAGVQYIKQITDASLYEGDLVEVMAARLAWLFSLKTTGDKALRVEVKQEADTAIAKAKMTNALGREDAGVPEDLWTDAQT